MAKKPTKYIFVTGGVLSGLGKGITAASIGKLLKARGLIVNLQKCDPYLNADAGLLNPREHGECFVTKDGAETDLDLGHYERFLDQELTQSSSLMSGKVLQKVIEDERTGKYDGQSVQIIPHVTNVIQNSIVEAGKGFDVHIVEIGGTVGDYESLSFMEAIRELGIIVGKENCLYVHVVYMPFLGASQEIKTKPAQNSVREIRGLGVLPDILVARSENPAPPSIKNKLALFGGVAKDAVALLPNAISIYEVPLTLEDTGIADVITKKLNLKVKKPDLKAWRKVVHHATSTNGRKIVKVAIIAKYLDNTDTYISVFEALYAAGWSNNINVELKWIDAEKLKSDKKTSKLLHGINGIVVPGGFGTRAIEGKIQAASYALKHKIPYLGLCLGLQVAIIAAARNAGIKDATTIEIDPNGKNLVINAMNDQVGKQNTGGTMRLGNYPCNIQKNSLSAKLYGTTKIVERHRHRCECNNNYRELYQKWGIKVVGTSPDNSLVELIEAIDHPFFVASQFHPEFKSRPNRPHPLFDGFIASLVSGN